MVARAVTLLLLAAAPDPELTIDLQPGPAFAATWIGPAGGSGAGEFRGSLSCANSPAAIPLVASADRQGERLRISARLRYAEIPADWADRWSPDQAVCAIRGDVTGAGAIDWSGRPDFGLAPGREEESVGRFEDLTSLQLIRLSDRAADVRAVIGVFNPFSFPLTVAGVSYRMEVRGEEIGAGVAKGGKLRPRKTTRFELDLRADPRRFRLAAGDRWAVGGDLEVRVVGNLAVRLSNAAANVPIRLAGTMGTDEARSGPLVLPDSTSLAPR